MQISNMVVTFLEIDNAMTGLELMPVDGNRLREIRKDHKDTQASLGRKLGFSTSMVRKWEQGTHSPSLETLKQICILYDVSSDFLLGLSRDDPKFSKKKQDQLSQKSKETLRQFEAFLIQQDRKNAKK